MKIIRNILVYVLLILALFSFVVVLYFYRVDIQSVPPKQLAESWNIKDTTFKNRKVYSITANEGASNDLHIIYLHGGSYVAEATNAHWNFIHDLAESTGATVILPDYPLTPKYKYTDVFDMLEPLYEKYLKKAGAENLILMGDSAGGGLALALAQKMGEEDIEQPKRLILLSPWLDVTMTNSEIDEVQENDPILIKETLRLAGIAYAGKENVTSYLVSPVYGPMEKLKNVTIYTGTYDILNPDVHVLDKRAKEVGLELDIRETKKALHTWMLENSELAKETFQDIVNLINSEIE